MALKATFTAGSDTTTVKGLFQWDYGQELEIEASDIGSEIVEIHFASYNMNEAIVRSCAFSNGTGRVAIPDTCLEQSSPITAWIYQIHGTGGHTIKTITMLVNPRTRPSVNRDIPAVISDRYTELITQVNESVDALENGSVIVAKAIEAQNATHATSASNASTANFATTAAMAQNATQADKATHADASTRADTAAEADTATTAGNIAEGYTALLDADIGKFAPKNRAYAFAFTDDSKYELVTVLLLPVPGYYDNQHSTRSASGEYIVYNPSAANKLTFYTMSNVSYSPSQVWYREL